MGAAPSVIRSPNHQPSVNERAAAAEWLWFASNYEDNLSNNCEETFKRQPASALPLASPNRPTDRPTDEQKPLSLPHSLFFTFQILPKDP
ncbi:jg4866 [Pararge aegeria aegeria]|uniref:Jg4866 protein n=1 Tax=Pararge aegeria aegeria TaxID=348720 RepID=A0A8S4QW31_9NEOP|nr:jg4866 [Pararge aegeria aegeria]